jgi:hypothetical protein
MNTWRITKKIEINIWWNKEEHTGYKQGFQWKDTDYEKNWNFGNENVNVPTNSFRIHIVISSPCKLLSNRKYLKHNTNLNKILTEMTYYILLQILMVYNHKSTARETT